VSPCPASGSGAHHGRRPVGWRGFKTVGLRDWLRLRGSSSASAWPAMYGQCDCPVSRAVVRSKGALHERARWAGGAPGLPRMGSTVSASPCLSLLLAFRPHATLHGVEVEREHGGRCSCCLTGGRYMVDAPSLLTPHSPPTPLPLLPHSSLPRSCCLTPAPASRTPDPDWRLNASKLWSTHPRILGSRPLLTSTAAAVAGSTAAPPAAPRPICLAHASIVPSPSRTLARSTSPTTKLD
jgi:hypothetical protein